MYSGVNKIVGILDEKKNGILTGKNGCARRFTSAGRGVCRRCSRMKNPKRRPKFSKFLLFPKPSTSLSDGVQWLLCFCRACFLTFGRRSKVLRHDHSLIWSVRLVQREAQRSRAAGRMSILWPLSVNLEGTEQLHSALTINYQARSADPVTARRVARYSPCSPKTPERSSAS